MRRQRNMAQMKEQNKTPEKELNRMETSNLSDAEFKTLVIRMIKELSDDLQSIIKIQSETKHTLIEIKNNLQGNNSKVAEAENQINDLEHKEAKNNPSDQQEERRIQKNQGTCKQPQRQIHAVQHSQHRGARRRRERTNIGNLFEKIMKENFLNLMKEINIQVQEAQSPKQDGCKEAHSKKHHN